MVGVVGPEHESLPRRRRRRGRVTKAALGLRQATVMEGQERAELTYAG